MLLRLNAECKDNTRMSQAELSTVCRCCLRGSLITISVFSRHNSCTYADMIRDCCSLEVTPVNEMSSHICLKCSRKLKSFCKFRRMCIKINNILMKNVQSLDCSLDKFKSEDIDKSTELLDELKNHPLETFNPDDNDVIKTELYDIKTEPDEDETFTIKDSHSQNESDFSDGPMNLSVLELTDIGSKEEIIDSIESEHSVKDEELLLPVMNRASVGEANNILQSDANYSSKIIKDDFESDPMEVSSAEAKKPRKHECLLCKKDCRTSQRLADHISWVHKGIKYYCELCKKSYTSKQRHIRNGHSKGRQCAICGLMCENQTKYYTHIQNKHRKGEPQPCTECPTVCSNNASLARHRTAVHGEAKYICQYCSRTFKRKDKLDEHIKTHTKEKPFACDVCPYRFPTKHLLTRHRRRHTAQRSIKCDYCESMFRTKEDLRQHITRHDGSFKPYACAVCAKRFRRSDHRNTHQTNVHKVEAAREAVKM